MTKICSNCGSKVDDNVNFCPDCRSQSFKGEITPAKSSVVVKTSPQSDLIYKLFYWKTDYGYMLSKSKLTSISVFLFFIACVFAGAPAPGAIALAFLFTALVFLLAFAIHKITSKKVNPEAARHNDYGLIADLKHLLFYWQNKKTGAFVISKTKICSHIIFLIGFVIFSFAPFVNFVGCIFAGLLFEIPAFLIGFAIHRITNPYPQGELIEKKISEKPKKTIERKVKAKIPKKVSIPKGDSQMEILRKEFDAKESNVRDLIEKRFEPPQLTYTRFIGIVDKSKELFYREYESANNLIKLNEDDSPRINEEIESKKEILRSIIQKIDDLSNELVLSMDSSKDGDVDNLIDDMENLIKSVKNYE